MYIIGEICWDRRRTLDILVGMIFSCVQLVRKVFMFLKEGAVMSICVSMNHLDVIHMKYRSGRMGLDLVSQSDRMEVNNEV